MKAELDFSSLASNNCPEKIVGELLIRKNLTLACAESCTGGLVAARITDLAGSSRYFQYGVVTYSNEAKQFLLGVQTVTLEKHGAVSAETACEMVAGARRVGSADVALAITGIAGPGGGTPEKPVGLVYIAVADENATICKEYRFAGIRSQVREQAVNQALTMIRGLLQTKE